MSDKTRPAVFIQPVLNALLVEQTAVALEANPIVYWAASPHPHLGYSHSQVPQYAEQELYTRGVLSDYIQFPDLQMRGPGWPTLMGSFGDYSVKPQLPKKLSQEEITAYFVKLFTELKAIVQVSPNILITLMPAMAPSVQYGRDRGWTDKAEVGDSEHGDY